MVSGISASVRPESPSTLTLRSDVPVSTSMRDACARLTVFCEAPGTNCDEYLNISDESELRSICNCSSTYDFGAPLSTTTRSVVGAIIVRTIGTSTRTTRAAVCARDASSVSRAITGVDDAGRESAATGCDVCPKNAATRSRVRESARAKTDVSLEIPGAKKSDSMRENASAAAASALPIFSRVVLSGALPSRTSSTTSRTTSYASCG